MLKGEKWSLKFVALVANHLMWHVTCPLLIVGWMKTTSGAQWYDTVSSKKHE